MPAASLVVPPALLLAGAALCWAGSRPGFPGGRVPAATAAWLAAAVLAGIWLGAGRAPLELGAGASPAAAPLGLRLDALSLACALALLSPAAFVLTFRPPGAAEAGLGLLATAAGVLLLEAATLMLAAVALGACVSFVAVALRLRDAPAASRFWMLMTAAWLLLTWAAATLDVRSGTTAFGAVPVSGLTVPIFVLIAVAALLLSGLLPAGAWPVWAGPGPGWTAGAPVGLLLPLGLYLLLRAYGLGGGQWPAGWLNAALAILGTATAAAAAVRAQAAATRPAYLAEMVVLAGGLALFGLALGTPLGLAAAVSGVLAAGLLAGLGPVLPAGAGPTALLGIAAAAGLPPALGFGARLLTEQAAFEAGNLAGLLGLVAAGAWLLGVAAGGRALRLPAPAAPAPGSAARLGVAAVVVLGAGLSLVESQLALPAAREVLGARAAALSTAGAGVATVSGAWAALPLGAPVLLVGALIALLSRPRWAGLAVPAGGPVPAPLFRLPAADGRAVPNRVAAARVPAEYRSLLDMDALEAAMAHSRPWLWVAVALAVAIAVNR